MKTWGNLLRKTVLLPLLMPLLLMAYSDADFDGVADEHDLCPNSTMLDIVNKDGCSIEKLVLPKSNQHVDLILGLNTVKLANTDQRSINESLQIDYYHHNFTLQLLSNNYEEEGLGDTTIALCYRLNPSSKLSLSLGASIILPTYQSDFDNNNVDYKLSTALTYQLSSLSIFLGSSYTLINDDDINGSNYNIHYQNSQNLYFGLGSYLSSRLYSSIIYSDSSAVYKGGEHLKSLSLYNHYRIDPHWFSRFGYVQGLNESSSDQLYLNMGYFF